MEQAYIKFPMDRVCAQTWRRNFTLLWENTLLVAGVSVKIDITYGGRTSIECATVKQYRKLCNILGVSRCYKDGLKNYSDIISQKYTKARK